MKDRIWFGRRAARILRIFVAFTPLVLAGQPGNASAQTLTILRLFGGRRYDGVGPRAGLVQANDGNFYGTTYEGGTSGNCSEGCGTVFRISASGSYTSLYSFVGSPNDGYEPMAGLVQGSDGNLYGTTLYGGTNYGGTVFRISPSGIYTSLYWFGSQPNDGKNPGAALLQSSDGNFYGTTTAGGTKGRGTVFRISPSGSETNLYSFAGPPNDGDGPHAGLVQGNDGNFYGTTIAGGTYGYGTVFQISPSGSETNLHSFAGYSDGYYAEAGLVQGSDGNLYGTTEYNVFTIGPGGSYSNLYTFGIQPNDASDCQAGLVQGSDGNFYGTTATGGIGGGTLFRITPSGTFTILYSFGSQPNDGINPDAGLVQGSDGNFYGTALISVFRFSVPLNPPANQISAAQALGNDLAISIPSVEGETHQLQFSTNFTSGIWSNINGVSVTNSIGALLTVTNFGGAVGPQGFYRFDITP